MRKLLFIVIGVLLLCSCEQKLYYTSKLELKQLVKSTEVNKESKGSYFLVGGSYSSKETTKTRIKVMANVNGFYKLIEIPFTQVRIKIDDTIKTPYLTISYYFYSPRTDEIVTDYFKHEIISKELLYYIYCPEKYLPEKLVPIEI